jgi:hypothetical protein
VAIQIVDCRNLRLRFPIAMGSTVAKMFNLVTKKREAQLLSPRAARNSVGVRCATHTIFPGACSTGWTHRQQVQSLFKEVRRRLEAAHPDVLLVLDSDHFVNFSTTIYRRSVSVSQTTPTRSASGRPPPLPPAVQPLRQRVFQQLPECDASLNSNATTREPITVNDIFESGGS